LGQWVGAWVGVTDGPTESFGESEGAANGTKFQKLAQNYKELARTHFKIKNEQRG
jgi:hypothetical protein